MCNVGWHRAQRRRRGSPPPRGEGSGVGASLEVRPWVHPTPNPSPSRGGESRSDLGDPGMDKINQRIAAELGVGVPQVEGRRKTPARGPEAEGAKLGAADKGVADAKAALEGARHILIERIGEAPALVGSLREWEWSEGTLASKVVKGKDADGAKFSDYFDFGQRIKDMPSHRALAMLRGRNEGVLDLDLDVTHEEGK